ncbi:EAL domain-containing protein [Clostridium brassicae]|uniref:EAL domain-containing protein n=1 Tax=Clostridium brassicae TaxID=2999072 RepID=A0ABT4D9T5_9CLOT|nr:EAL domain-containing protein [Clostridium brassicae]MCY6959077.1 EAL domain-containing protein [Clostridium brassicae]
MVKYDFSQLIDITKLQSLMDAFYKASGIRTSILDLKGNILTSSKWNRGIRDFYRTSAVAAPKYAQNYKNFFKECNNKKKYIISQHDNGMYYIGTPILVEECHLATIVYSQFYLEGHELEISRKKFEESKTDETEYKNDTKKIEVVSVEKLKYIIDCLVKFSEWVGEMGHNQLKLLQLNEKLNDNYEIRVKTEKATKKLAYYNPITELRNRAYVVRKLPAVINNIKKDKSTVALCILDVDNFKAINDTFGHFIGDKFLKEVSVRLKKVLGLTDEIYHIGGDEFLFLIKSVTDKKVIEDMGQKLLNTFKEPFYIENHEIYYITASMGIAMLTSKKDGFQELFNYADDALHYAKKEGKDRYKIYTSNMHSTLYCETKFKNDLKMALNNDEFKVYYQPKIDIVSGNISGVEALVRWIRQDGKIIPPNKFISFTEKTGLIGNISEKVTRKACIQNRMWQQAKDIKFRTAVNLSAFQLQDKELFEKIQSILKDTGLSPEFFEVEITESVIMNNFKQSVNTLNRLREIGVKVSLDDFGTGYSSLNYLKNLPIDSIKLDKSFVDNLTMDSKERFIVSTIINLSHGVDLKVIAEGVESKEQLKILQEYKCDEIQGYYFSKPVPPKEFEIKFL